MKILKLPQTIWSFHHVLYESQFHTNMEQQSTVVRWRKLGNYYIFVSNHVSNVFANRIKTLSWSLMGLIIVTSFTLGKQKFMTKSNFVNGNGSPEADADIILQKSKKNARKCVKLGMKGALVIH